MFAEGTGIGVSLGAAGDLAGVWLLRAEEDKKTRLASERETHGTLTRYQEGRCIGKVKSRKKK